ncbi:MAG: VrrA/YqfQ family protein [Bacilli bacterium]
MNYNPYLYTMPINYLPAAGASKGLLGGLFGGMKFSSLLSGAGKTLNVVNQALPLVKQATPVLKNAKTMFKVMNEFKKIDTPKKNNAPVSRKVEPVKITPPKANDGGPVFFM